MQFLYSNNKPTWLDDSIKWRSDLWEDYVNKCIVYGKKMWLSNISELITLFNSVVASIQKLEIISVIYAIILDNKFSCKLQKIWWTVLINKLDYFGTELDGAYFNMFNNIKKELQTVDSKNVYNCVEEYVLINNNYELNQCYCKD